MNLFESYFVPFVRDYNKKQNLDNALLFIDNNPSHPTNLNSMYPRVSK